MSENSFLSPSDSGDLYRLEGVIKTGEDQFLAVADALLEIRERRLYRKDFAKFETYCQQKWGWGRRRVNYLISASVVVQGLTKDLGTSGSQIGVDNTRLTKDAKIPSNERAVRELSRVKPADRSAILNQLSDHGIQPTAAAIKSAAKEKPVQDAIELDKMGFPIPPLAMPVWRRVSEVHELLSSVTTLRSKVKAAEENGDILFAECIMSSLHSGLDRVYSGLKCAVPYAVCTNCQGKLVKSCTLCKGRGMISKFLWDTAIPLEVRALREKQIEKLK